MVGRLQVTPCRVGIDGFAQAREQARRLAQRGELQRRTRRARLGQRNQFPRGSRRFAELRAQHVQGEDLFGPIRHPRPLLKSSLAILQRLPQLASRFA